MSLKNQIDRNLIKILTNFDLKTKLLTKNYINLLIHRNLTMFYLKTGKLLPGKPKIEILTLKTEIWSNCPLKNQNVHKKTVSTIRIKYNSHVQVIGHRME